MQNIELFEYLKLAEKESAINGIPLNELKLILTGNKSTSYELMADKLYCMIFKNLRSGEIITLNCIKQYYNLKLSANTSLDKLQCYNIKKDFMHRSVPGCITGNCAQCHAACIEDFFNKEITKK